MQYYGRDFDGLAAADPFAAADLVSQLPISSRVTRALDPDNAPPDSAVLLMAIECDLRAIAWGLGGGTGKQPEPMTAASLKSGAVQEVDWKAFVDARLASDKEEGGEVNGG